jgi:AbrB family looped-hinge helix DNA binding protein
MGIIQLKTATISEKGQIVIPKDIRRIKGFEEGKKVAIMAFDDHVELRPLEQISKKINFEKESILTALISEKTLAKDWLSKEDDEAWKDL